MTTRRGSQYSNQLDRDGLRGRIDSSKRKRKGNICSGTESTQVSALSQRQVLEMPIISEPELEISMRNSNRYKSHSEGSHGHLHEPVQAVLHGVQGQRLGNVASNIPRSDELLANPEIVPQRGGDSQILKSMKSTFIQGSNKKYQGVHAKKKEEAKEEAPVAPTSKPQANPLPQEGKKNKKKNWRKPYSPIYRIPRI
ncbi:hypothetical protein O181_133405 [Austropuccinia psidii MF-1]|uniref:Uncharacterized protein n=1 Tax=Austropuccinia psidii MF-1 TaxID=1389203 RepID=A0A9Q3QDJ0_9BASI|nr:hypothetical protein [Austropuccinia psidii MF-1]